MAAQDIAAAWQRWRVLVEASRRGSPMACVLQDAVTLALRVAANTE